MWYGRQSSYWWSTGRRYKVRFCCSLSISKGEAKQNMNSCFFFFFFFVETPSSPSVVFVGQSHTFYGYSGCGSCARGWVCVCQSTGPPRCHRRKVSEWLWCCLPNNKNTHTHTICFVVVHRDKEERSAICAFDSALLRNGDRAERLYYVRQKKEVVNVSIFNNRTKKKDFPTLGGRTERVESM